VQVTAVRAHGQLRKPDSLVSEEPLEIRVAGPDQDPQPVGVTMRTPGNDFELAAGFLLSEGIIAGQSAIRSVGYCTATDGRPELKRYNVVTVNTTDTVDLVNQRRLFTISSACGVCGRSGLDQVEKSAAPLPPRVPWPIGLLMSLPDSLRPRQSLFSKTGGLHGAGLFDRSGGALAVREDIGRHNAVDKLVGWASFNRRLPLNESALVVSGRLGFEIVQKAAMAGIPQIVAVSAPSSLAIELAARMGMTVTAFVRGDRANVYCGDSGITFPA
jgi:FdhD protein